MSILDLQALETTAAEASVPRQHAEHELLKHFAVNC